MNADANEVKMNGLAKGLREYLAECNHNFRPTEIIELVRLIRDIADAVFVPEVDYRDHTAAFGNMSAWALGQMVMQNLGHSDEPLYLEHKVYWLRVASELGPDHIEQFRKVGAYMAKVESF